MFLISCFFLGGCVLYPREFLRVYDSDAYDNSGMTSYYMEMKGTRTWEW